MKTKRAPRRHVPASLAAASLAMMLGALGCDDTKGANPAPDSVAPVTPTATEAASEKPAEKPVEKPVADSTAPANSGEPTPTPSADASAKQASDTTARGTAKPGTATTPKPKKQTGPVAGKPWSTVASVSADKGYKCNDKYPHKFTASGGSNVDYPNPKTLGSCAGKGITVSVPFVPKAAGPGTVAGTLRYGICDEAKTNCRVVKKAMSIPFTAE